MAVAQLSATMARADDADPSEKVSFDIPRQRADLALIEFAKQADVTFIFPLDEAQRKTSNRVVGDYTRDEAIRILLKGTGLRPEFDEHGALAVRSNRDADTTKGNAMGRSERKRFSGIAAAILSIFSSQGVVGQEAEANQGLGTVEEVIVTAQKRSEDIQDVPVPVTAVDATSLISKNQVRLQDYFSSIPGLNLTTADFSRAQVLTIRGLTTGGYSNPTVGITVDDIPYGSSTSWGLGVEAPDIDPSILDTIEVLRGPQGTLYGANTLGGLLKYVTIAPSTDLFTGRLQAGVSSVKNGDDVGYSIRGAANLPISDSLAVRASGFTRGDSGYVDNIRNGDEGLNQVAVIGGRISALWQPSESVSLRLSAMGQETDADGNSEEYLAATLGRFDQDAVPGTGRYKKTVETYGANLNVRIGSIDVTSLTGYNINSLRDDWIDFSPAFGGAALATFGVAGAPLVEDIETTKLTQEVRIYAPIGEHFEWLIGGFYTDEESDIVQDAMAADPVTGSIVGSLLHLPFTATYEEIAAFTNLTINVTDHFNVQIGGRYGTNDQTFNLSLSGPLIGGSTIVQPEIQTDDSSFTYLVTPQYRFSQDVMVYGRFASGYRPGGPNSTIGAPSSFGPDTTQNYEMGAKGSVFDDKLTFDASLYYINWKDVQIHLVEGGFGYFANAGRARSRGVELSFTAIPRTGLTVSGWGSWNDAELTEDFPSTADAFGESGDRLPGSTRYSANLSMDQELPLPSNLIGVIGASISYVGKRSGLFGPVSAPQRQIYPAYTNVDVRASVKYESWSGDFFVTNVTDKRGELGGGLVTLHPTAFTYIQPRTFGFSLSRDF
ncbi:MAG: TonB-dependent receptor [Gammaproteobacteria bacterium]|nr:TonB-dependent receptor [Gammaproteobacteria bacterium]